MGSFSSCTGAFTLFMMLLGQRIFKWFGWGVAALVTPINLLLSGGVGPTPAHCAHSPVPVPALHSFLRLPSS